MKNVLITRTRAWRTSSHQTKLTMSQHPAATSPGSAVPPSKVIQEVIINPYCFDITPCYERTSLIEHATMQVCIQMAVEV